MDNANQAQSENTCLTCNGTKIILSESYGFAGLSEYDCPDCQAEDEVEECPEPLHWGYRFGFELAAIGIKAASYKRTNDAAKALAFGMLGKAVA